MTSVIHIIFGNYGGGIDTAVRNYVSQEIDGLFQKRVIIRLRGVNDQSILGLFSFLYRLIIFREYQGGTYYFLHGHQMCIVLWLLRLLLPKSFIEQCVPVFHGEYYAKSKLKQKFVNSLYTWSLKRFKKVVSVSQYSKHVLGRSNIGSIVLNNPLAPDYLKLLSINAKQKRNPRSFIAVGRLVDVKNWFFLVDIFTLIKERGYCFEVMIAGDGPLEAELKGYVDEKGLAEHLIFLGQLSDIKDFYCASTYYISTSKFENNSLALLEAMSAGCIPFVSNVGGNSEIIEHSVNGFLISLDDKHTWIETILGEFQNHFISSSVVKASIDEKFGPTVFATNYCKVLKR